MLWDVDGTILNFDAAEKEALKTLFEKYNLGTFTDEMLKRYIEINIKYWQALERKEMTKQEILVERFKEFFSKEGIDNTISEKFNQEYQVTMGDTIVVNDDALDIIKEQKKNCKIVIITNGTAVAQSKKLAKTGLDNLADYIFISEKVGADKPNIEYFNKVIEEVGITDLSEALIIGDSLTSDIQGGINCGIDTCWYNQKEMINNKNIIPTYTIKNLHELEKIINI